MVDIMEKYNPCLDLKYPKVKEQKSDHFQLLNPTLQYSITPAFSGQHLDFLTQDPNEFCDRLLRWPLQLFGLAGFNGRF